MKLQTRVLSVLVPLAAVSGSVIMFFSRDAVNTILVQGIAQRGFLELSEVVPRMNPGMQAREEKTLLPLLHSVMGRMRASYAMALDPSGVVLAHTDVLEKGKIYGDPITRQALGQDMPDFRTLDIRGKKVLDISMPIWAADEDFIISHEQGGRTRLGTLRLGLSLEEALGTRAKILSRLAVILLMTGGVIVLVLLLFLRRMLLPIHLLAATTRKIGGGQYGVTVPVLTRDELGDLTQSFNKMSKDLGATTVSKDYLDGVIQSMADMLIVTNSKGKIRTINRAALDVLGYSERELLDGSALRLFGSKSPEKESEAEDEEDETLHIFEGSELERLTRTGVVKDMELNFLTKAGEPVPVLLSGSVLKNREGKAEGLVLAVKDLSERKKLETMLVQSEKLSAVGQLAAGVAHEINNPLGIILGFAQSATKRIQPTDALALPIKSIEREALRCKNLVQNLLTFSRQNKPRMAELDLNEAVTSTLSIIEAQARVKAVEVLKELGTLESVLGDKNQLQQVIVNLCNNAIDAMPNGGKITVRTRQNPRDVSRRAVLEIEDTGSGIPENIRDKIFNPFFTTKEVGKGTGLGLSLVFEIIQRHKGGIEVRSEEGRGTTFAIFFPAKESIVAEVNQNGDQA